jgi:hypothetical protein
MFKKLFKTVAQKLMPKVFKSQESYVNQKHSSGTSTVADVPKVSKKDKQPQVKDRRKDRRGFAVNLPNSWASKRHFGVKRTCPTDAGRGYDGRVTLKDGRRVCWHPTKWEGLRAA